MCSLPSVSADLACGASSLQRLRYIAEREGIEEIDKVAEKALRALNDARDSIDASRGEGEG